MLCDCLFVYHTFLILLRVGKTGGIFFSSCHNENSAVEKHKQNPRVMFAILMQSTEHGDPHHGGLMRCLLTYYYLIDSG